MSDSRTLIDKRKLRMKRIRAGLTQSALARRADLHPSYIRLLELGERGGSPETLNTLADVFGCDITELMPDEVAA